MQFDSANTSKIKKKRGKASKNKSKVSAKDAFPEDQNFYNWAFTALVVDREAKLTEEQKKSLQGPAP
jgi:hypothetical protein